MTAQELFARAHGKDALFITTKNLDYLRNTQELALLRQHARSVTVLGYHDKSYLKRLVKLYARLFFGSYGRYGYVFVGFAPQLVLPFFHWKFKGFKAVDFFISMYDTLVCDRRRVKPGSLPARLLHWFDRRTLALCDAAVADTRADASYFAEEFGADSARTATLYLTADRSIYYPRPADKPAGAPPFLVLYFGSILPLQGVEVILECARLLRDDTRIGFSLIGPLSEKALAVCGELPNVRTTRWLSQPELAAHIAQADLCLAGHFNAAIDKASRTVPGKAYIYEAMEKPMVLGDNPANHEVFTPDARHIFIPMGSPAALCNAILCALTGLERKGIQ